MKCAVCKQQSDYDLCETCWEKVYTTCCNCNKYRTTKQMKYQIPKGCYFCKLQCLKEYAKNE